MEDLKQTCLFSNKIDFFFGFSSLQSHMSILSMFRVTESIQTNDFISNVVYPTIKETQVVHILDSIQLIDEEGAIVHPHSILEEQRYVTVRVTSFLDILNQAYDDFVKTQNNFGKTFEMISKAYPLIHDQINRSEHDEKENMKRMRLYEECLEEFRRLLLSQHLRVQATLRASDEQVFFALLKMYEAFERCDWIYG